MIKTIVSDFSHVLLFAKDKNYLGKLNDLNDQLRQQPNYEPLDYFEINQPLLDFLGQLPGELNFYIFTAGKMHLLPSLKNKLSQVFTHFFTETEVGFAKDNPQAFHQLAQLIKVPENEIFFMDDKNKNVMGAQQAGVQAVQFISNEQIKIELTSTLNK